MTMAEQAMQSQPTMAELAMQDKPTMAELAVSNADKHTEVESNNYSDYLDVYDKAGLDTPYLNLRQVFGQDKTDVDTARNEVSFIKSNKMLNDAPLEDSALDPMMMAPSMTAKLIGVPAGTALGIAGKYGSKGLGLATDAVGVGLKPINKLLGKATAPIVDKTINALKSPSPTGSIRDWLKTNFVQDYKLSDEFVDMIDTELRRGKVQNDQVMDAINTGMSGLSKRDRDIVQYLVSKDGVAFPDARKIIEEGTENWRLANRGLYTRANSMRKVIFNNQKNLNKFGMLDDKHVQNDFFPRDRAYVNHQYKDREALNEKTMDPSLERGRTIEGRRGMYNDDGSFVRSFTDAERAVMKPETDYVAEKTIAKQLDDVLQGRVMQKTLEMKDLIKTPEEMKLFAGKTPSSQQNGYTLMNGSEYGNLNGKYVQTQTANRLKSMVDDVNHEPSLWNNYRKYVGQWKANVTIKNPKTHVNNMLGNVGMMTTASDIPVSKVPSILSDGLKIHKEGTANDVYKSARDSGLLERTKVQELAQMSGFDNAVSKIATDDSKLKTFGKNAYLSEDSKMGKPIFDAYQKEDEVFKLGIFNHYLKQGMSSKEARKATEKIVFDYAKKLPRGVEFLRDTGLIPFVTWSYRSLPMFADVLKNRPAQLALTAGALALMNEDDNSITEPTVGGRKLNVNNITPYMEYLNPQQFVSDQLLSGIPQQLAAIASGNQLNYGRMRTLDRKGTDKIDSLLGRAKAIKDLVPIPDGYLDLFDPTGQSILTDVQSGKRSLTDSAIHRLLFTNSPEKSNRNRKLRHRPSRKRDGN